MYLYHNSRDKKYKSQFGACKINSKVTLRLDVYDAIPGLQVFLSTFSTKTGPNRIEMKKTEQKDNLTVYEIELQIGDEPSLMWYFFVAQNYNETFYYGNNEAQCGGEGMMSTTYPRGYQITIYKEDSTPSWYKEGIAYQIFPDRFNRGKNYLEYHTKCAQDDLETKRHNYLEEDWNATPYYTKDKAGNVTRWQYFGGTLDGIIEKIPYLKELNVSVLYLNPIFEAHSNHKYDTANYMKIDPHFGNEQVFKELIKKCKENGIHLILDGVFSHTGQDSIYFQDAIKSKESKYYPWYRFTNYPNEYECWWNVKDLPNVNELDETYSNFIYKDDDSVIKHYLKLGIDGWRLDVCDELPDAFIKGIREAMTKVNNNSVLLGEVWEDASNKKSYDTIREYLYGSELQSVMNYCFRTSAIDFFLGKIDANTFVDQIYNIMEHYPKEYFYSNFNILGTHDRARILTEMSGINNDYNLAVARLKVLSVLQFTIPGIPCIYYGDEAGLTGTVDPDNRKTYPWGKEDINLLNHYKQISALRTSSKAFSIGTFEPFSFGKHVFAYKRTYENECYLVLIHRGIFPEEEEHIQYELSHNGKSKQIDLILKPLNYEIIKL